MTEGGFGGGGGKEAEVWMCRVGWGQKGIIWLIRGSHVSATRHATLSKIQ